MAAEKIEHMNRDILNDVGRLTAALIDMIFSESPHGSLDVGVELMAIKPDKDYRFIWNLTYPNFVRLSNSSLGLAPESVSASYLSNGRVFEYNFGEKGTQNSNDIVNYFRDSVKQNRLESLKKEARHKRKVGILLSDAVEDVTALSRKNPIQGPTPAEIEAYKKFYCDFSK